MFLQSFKDINESSADSVANMYLEKYPEQLQAYMSGSMVVRCNESMPAHELIAMGQQFDQYQNYQEFVNESFSNLGALGAVPQIALDVISAGVANSILPLISSIQPITEEHSIVYYKQIKAAEAAGQYEAGEVIRDALTRNNLKDGSLGSQRKMVVLGTGDGTTTAFSGQFDTAPVRPYYIELNVNGVGTGKDNGEGKILGFGFEGTINYESGAWTLAFNDALADGTAINAMYDVDVDMLNSLEKIQAGLATKDIKAEIWTLAADIGTFSNFAFANRFGRNANDEVAADLSSAITDSLNTQAVLRIYNNAVSNTNWNKTPLSGTSYVEHKLGFVDALATTESVLHLNSGAGTISRIIAGRTAAATLRGMPAWRGAPSESKESISLYGYYDGVPVIRATQIVPDNEMICLANPDGYFNAPLAYSPFMPLLVTDTIQNPDNPFRGTKAAGVWAGMTPLNSNLATKLTITTE